MINDQMYRNYLTNRIDILEIENKRLNKLNLQYENQIVDTEIKLNKAIVLLDKIAKDSKTDNNWKILITKYIEKLNQPA